MNEEKLFADFKPISTEKWRDKIDTDLKGADFQKKLVWITPEGFEVQPFYRFEDLEKLDMLDACPGDFPFVRGRKVKGNDWLVRQDIRVSDVTSANTKALDIRMKGVDSLGFVMNDRLKPTVENIEQLLQNIRADVMELNFNSPYPLDIINIIKELATKYNRDFDKLNGSVDFDPLREYSLHGKFRNGFEHEFELLEKLMQVSEFLPNFHVLTVDGAVFQNAGSGIVTQLAFTLAKGADYLTYLTGKGFDIDAIAPKIRFHFAVGSSYFMEIAKFRAARYLWANIVNAYGIGEANNAAMYIHCSNSEWNKTIYDPYVNMLRTTTETMSSLIGGVDSMTTLPFNAVYEEATVFSERIARNQQLLLKGESYFDKVADPSAGSYYIEALTKHIIDHAWDLFLEIDDMGGYKKAFEKGFINDHLTKESKQKDRDIAIRKRILLGTNQYPNTGESIESLTPDHEVAKSDANTINLYRGAVAFERLRMNTEKFAQNNRRPQVWMFTFGNLAMRNARAQFAANFFGCAGFEILNNTGFKNIAEGIEVAKKKKPEIVVICSSDEDYKDSALEIFNALKEEAVVVLAGYPKPYIEKFQAGGLENFIHIKSNVLEELNKYQNMLGIL